MPSQNKFAIYEIGLIAGFIGFLDIFQGLGQWAFAFVIGVFGPAIFIKGLAAKIAALAISIATAKTLDFAIGLLFGAMLGVAMSLFAFILLAWIFYQKRVPLFSFLVPLLAASSIEFVPFMNVAPGWTLASIYIMFSANGWLGIIGDIILGAVTGGASVAAGLAAKTAARGAGATAMRAGGRTLLAGNGGRPQASGDDGMRQEEFQAVDNTALARSAPLRMSDVKRPYTVPTRRAT